MESVGQEGCAPACVVPLAIARAPSPPYQPMRYSVQLVWQPRSERTISLTMSPALALTRFAYAST